MATQSRRLVNYALAIVTGVLGAGSLLLFGLFLWMGALGIVDLGMSQRSLLIWDASLCLLFFLQHSGMVRKSFRAWLGRFVPAYLQGIVYTMASGIALVLLVVGWQPAAANVYALEGTERYLIRGVLLLAFAGVVWGIRSLGEFDAFGIQMFLTHIRMEQPHPGKLTIQGPYRLVRHPFYACAIVAVWAAPVLSIDRLVFSSLFTIWVVLGATLEERDLLAQFGEDYRLYQHDVPMLIPRWRTLRGRIAATAGSSCTATIVGAPDRRRTRR